MKKKLVLIVTGVLLLAGLIPIPFRLKDGGTVEYRAMLYTISQLHRLNEEGAEKPFQEGVIVKVLGKELYHNVK